MGRLTRRAALVGGAAAVAGAAASQRIGLGLSLPERAVARMPTPFPLTYPTMLVGGASVEQLGDAGTSGTPRAGHASAGLIHWANETGATRLYDTDIAWRSTAPYIAPPTNYASAAASFSNGGEASRTIGQQVPLIVSAMQALPVGKRACYYTAGRNPLDDGVSVSTYLSTVTGYFDTLLGAADLLIVPGLWKCDTSVGGIWASGGSARTAVEDINAGLAALCATRGRSLFVPFQDVMNDASGDQNPKAGYTFDGRHPTPIGAQAMGARLKSYLVPSYIAPRSYPSSPSNLAPAMTGTSGTLAGNATGTVYTGFTGTKNSSQQTCVFSQPSAGVQRMSVTRAAGQSQNWVGGQIEISAASRPAAVVGGVYRARARIVIAPTSVPLCFDVFLSEFQDATGIGRAVAKWANSGVEAVISNATASTAYPIDASAGLSLWVETPNYTIVSTSGAITLGFYFRTLLQIGAAATVDFDLSDIQIERVS